MKSYKSSYQDWNEYRKEEEYLDGLQRFTRRLDEENITGVLKDSAIGNFIQSQNNALQCNLKVV